MSASEVCLRAINQEWKYYERYTALVYPFDNNLIHAALTAVIPQMFASMYETRVQLGANLLRHGRSCAIAYTPLSNFSNIASLINLAIYFFPPYGNAERSVMSISLVGSEIEKFVSRPLLAGALTFILTGVFYSLSVIHHPVREVRRIRPMLPFLMTCFFLVIYGSYIFYATCQLNIRNQVTGDLYKHC